MPATTAKKINIFRFIAAVQENGLCSFSSATGVNGPNLFPAETY
jgi:hypothetical protein